MILVADGYVTYQFFQNQLKGKLNEKTVILFNSCEVFNEPFKSAVIVNADSQKYLGGITTLQIGPSENASVCFWTNEWAGKSMTASIAQCNKDFDGDDTFGIDGKGSDIFDDGSKKSSLLWLNDN